MARKRKATEDEANETGQREFGTVVEVDETSGLAYEVRKDGSIAYFTQEKAEHLLREVGS